MENGKIVGEHFPEDEDFGLSPELWLIKWHNAGGEAEIVFV